jgi:hypothetical protein
MNAILPEAFKHLIIGMPTKEAELHVRTNGFIFRVVSEDGINFGGAAEHHPLRINVETIDGRISHAYVG